MDCASCQNYPPWKKDQINALKEAISFFGNGRKLEREIWVTEQLLSRLGIEVGDENVQEANEPADTSFEDARFQVKELYPDGRHRVEEYKKKLTKAKAARDQSELLEGYSSDVITFTEIVSRCAEYTRSLIEGSKYGSREVESLDLLYYFNDPSVGEVDPTDFEMGGFPFRSISVLSNRYASVLSAGESAPRFIRDNLGRVCDSRST